MSSRSGKHSNDVMKIEHTLNFKKGRKEGNGLFNNTLNTLIRLYGMGHMVKDLSDSERGNPLLPNRHCFLISSKDSFMCTIPQIG